MVKQKPRLLSTLNFEKVDRPPIWLMRQAGRYLPEYREIRRKTSSFLSLCYSPELAAEVTLQPLKRFPLDAAIIFSDILVIPDALGQKVDFREGIGPVLSVLERPFKISEYKQNRVGKYLSPVYEALRIVRNKLPKNKTLIGFSGAPWTVATYMLEGGSSRNFANIKSWAFNEPKNFGQLISMLEHVLAEHLICQINAGADVVQIFDSWAGVLPDGAFEKWSVEPISRIAKKVSLAKPGVPIIVFPRLAGLKYGKFKNLSGVSAISIDQTVPLDWAQGSLQGETVLQGNLDPVFLVCGGKALEKETKRILEIVGNKQFIFNLGHGVLPQTPPENVSALCKIVLNWKLNEKT